MTEDQLQQKVVIDFNNSFSLKNMTPRAIIFAVPNGGSRNLLEAKKLKATGVLAGVSDLICIAPDKKIYFLELKTEKGVQSDSQKDFEKRVTDLGYCYVLIKNWQDYLNFKIKFV
jgi:hypothetical protein